MHEMIRPPRHRPRPLSGFEVLEDRSVPSSALNGLEGESVARLWNEELLAAIRVDTPRPTVHARNLFHTSVAMYDAWASYDPQAKTFIAPDGVAGPDSLAAREEAVSFAAYRVLSERFAESPGAAQSLTRFDALMDELGYNRNFVSVVGNTPAAVGNRVASLILSEALGDGSNEAGNYADTTGYQPSNPPLVVTERGADLSDPNRWQPLTVDGKTQVFLTPHWGDVTSFALERDDPDDVFYDVPSPPLLSSSTDAEFKRDILSVIRFSSVLDPDTGTMIDASPGAIGRNPLGTNAGTGHPINPATNRPYDPNPINLADYGRVLAEFWADGPASETPPGHWNVLANEATDSLEAGGVIKRIGGPTGEQVSDLEWDVKLYFALNGALHDAAIAAWDAKEAYDYVRPISMIRYMGGLGQSSDPSLPSFNPQGLPLEQGLVELITPETTAPGERHAHLAGQEGEIAIFAWSGHPESASDIGGVGWILAEDWLPYQLASFVTPGFAAYVSGHSTFSRAAAEVLTNFTGSAFFPGGLGTFEAAPGFLKFENGPSEPMTLQWGTYYDAADEAGLSRLYGGIHVAADDFEGRILGAKVGTAAYHRALDFFDSVGPQSPVPFFAVGPDAGSPPVVQLIDPDTGAEVGRFLAYDPTFTGGVRVVTADVTGDNVPDVLTVPGPGAPPLLRVFDGTTGALLREIRVFEESFTGGVFVAAADLNGDGLAEVVLSPDFGGSSRVRVLDGRDFLTLADFFTIEDANYRGGVQMALGDLNGDGVPDLMAGAATDGPRVAVFDGITLFQPGTGGLPPKITGDFFVFEPSARLGVRLSSGDVNGDGVADLLAAAGKGGAPRVIVLRGQDLIAGAGPNTSRIADFFAGDSDARAGVSVTVKNLNGNAREDIIAAAGGDGPLRVIGYRDDSLGLGEEPEEEFSVRVELPDGVSGVFVG